MVCFWIGCNHWSDQYIMNILAYKVFAQKGQDMNTQHKFFLMTVFFIMAMFASIHAVADGNGYYKEIDGVKYPYNRFVLAGESTLQSITISGSASIDSNSSETYTCTALFKTTTDSYSFHTQRTVTPTWTVTPPIYASIDEAGVMTNKNKTRNDQTVTLTASYDTKTVSKTITLAGLAPTNQIVSLNAGWNWVSFKVLPDSHKIADVLGTTSFAVNDIILTNGGMARFNGTGWLPSSFTIEYGKMYQIYMGNATTVTVSGYAGEMWYVPLEAGWNWIANPLELSANPAKLAHNGGWTVGDRIQSMNGIVTYTGSKWIPATDFSLVSGNGYQIYTANAGALAFPADGEDETLYAVVDLSGGPNALSYPVRYTNTAPDLNDDTCRTTELWLRKIPAGTFMMGSPSDELGYEGFEIRHEVTLTDDYYIGVFECTQKQWELVMGSNPSQYKGDCRPVERVSYDMIRGTGEQAGAGWPTYGHAVDLTSFMGKLQGKTGLLFDLPTVAQWEYACRAGTTTALNSGKNLLTAEDEEDANMNEVGRNKYNQSDRKGGYSQHTKVGSYLRNAWGLYDMHGNESEWCLDWLGNYSMAMVNPTGPNTGTSRMLKGGDFHTFGKWGRASVYFNSLPSTQVSGFRIVFLP